MIGRWSETRSYHVNGNSEPFGAQESEQVPRPLSPPTWELLKHGSTNHDERVEIRGVVVNGVGDCLNVLQFSGRTYISLSGCQDVELMLGTTLSKLQKKHVVAEVFCGVCDNNYFHAGTSGRKLPRHRSTEIAVFGHFLIARSTAAQTLDLAKRSSMGATRSRDEYRATSPIIRITR